MNQVSPKKLLHSKWTAVLPQNREKHFMVTEVEFDDDARITLCVIQAVLTNRETVIDWKALKQSENWLPGWK